MAGTELTLAWQKQVRYSPVNVAAISHKNTEARSVKPTEQEWVRYEPVGITIS